MTEKTLEQKGKEEIELRRIQAQPLSAIFSMNDIQAKIALCMVMFGVNFDYAIGVTLRLSPEN